MDKSKIVQNAYLISEIFEDDGQFPNNQTLPLMIYKGALLMHPSNEVTIIKEVFAHHNWSNSWVNDIFDYHHYHSNTHEVLGIYCGTAQVQFGGPSGTCFELTRGDVVIIPAGVAHKKLSGGADFTCVGAYPQGKEYDIKLGKADERPNADENIAAVALPTSDPVYSDGGKLKECWHIPLNV